jgi:hypothetical protein
LFQAAGAVKPAAGDGLDISARCFQAGKLFPLHSSDGSH